MVLKVLQLDPSFSLAWDNLAKLYRIQNKLLKSIPAFENLIKLDPRNFEALVSLGTVFIKLSKYHEGIKLYEESGELSQAILKDDKEGIIDAIGDSVVVLTNLAHLVGTNIEDCIGAAYTEISNRTGRMINGTFIKDA